MGIKLHKHPKLKSPIMIIGWPGISNIGLIAVDTLRELTKAEELGEIESYEFFPPSKVVIKSGLLEDLEFPTNKFYFRRIEGKDLIFFVGEEQPRRQATSDYAEGEDAYQMANLVLDVAEKFGCQRVYTSGAALSLMHHTMESRVWAVPNTERLIKEIKRYANTIVMSEIEGRGGQGYITGLNGLLLGVAKKRGLEGICLMGEIPIYLQGLPIIYPKASKSVLDVFSNILGINFDLNQFNETVQKAEKNIEKIYSQIPPEMRNQLEKLKEMYHLEPTEIKPMTEENRKKLWEEISDFLKKGGKGDEEAL
jgi:proteasome assembly chaperone (PAC2) family protein